MTVKKYIKCSTCYVLSYVILMNLTTYSVQMIWRLTYFRKIYFGQIQDVSRRDWTSITSAVDLFFFLIISSLKIYQVWKDREIKLDHHKIINYKIINISNL